MSSKSSFAIFRIENEIKEMLDINNTNYKIEDLNDDKFILAITFTIEVQKGIYKNRKLVFIIKITNKYPFESPRVCCKSKVFHPNIDFEGNVCLEILREGWSCGYGIENIFVNLCIIMEQLSSENCLNREAGDLLDSNYEEFVRKAHETR